MTSNLECSDAPRPVKDGVFSYSRDDLTVHGIRRAPPHVLAGVFDKDAPRAARRKATRPWVIAQLRLYGIEFPASGSAVELKGLLEAAYREGKV
ncbi:hypothetical protein BO71DRAFT_401428 [Aspergillus ellipticus CBS 707.79]|uniref:Uncharacterized protein n=1 Tax=Aspergillus ellipticus CBS 707.79 TaxID=1448320 RepID=A0A319D1N7_9EURO|nr:hypothetical protein BO71DRAFT_401428 [Aspergillus ellipticus CBS 707.79]